MGNERWLHEAQIRIYADRLKANAIFREKIRAKLNDIRASYPDTRSLIQTTYSDWMADLDRKRDAIPAQTAAELAELKGRPAPTSLPRQSSFVVKPSVVDKPAPFVPSAPLQTPAIVDKPAPSAPSTPPLQTPAEQSPPPVPSFSTEPALTTTTSAKASSSRKTTASQLFLVNRLRTKK